MRTRDVASTETRVETRCNEKQLRALLSRCTLLLHLYHRKVVLEGSPIHAQHLSILCSGIPGDESRRRQTIAQQRSEGLCLRYEWQEYDENMNHEQSSVLAERRMTQREREAK